MGMLVFNLIANLAISAVMVIMCTPSDKDASIKTEEETVKLCIIIAVVFSLACFALSAIGRRSFLRVVKCPNKGKSEGYKNISQILTFTFRLGIFALLTIAFTMLYHANSRRIQIYLLKEAETQQKPAISRHTDVVLGFYFGINYMWHHPMACSFAALGFVLF
jgi:hypothetical protein